MAMYTFLQILGVIMGLLMVGSIILFIFSGCDGFAALIMLVVIGINIGVLYVTNSYETKNTQIETVVVEGIIEDKQISSVENSSGITEDRFHIVIDMGGKLVTLTVKEAEFNAVREGDVVKIEKTIKTVFGEKKEPTYRLVLEETTS